MRYLPLLILSIAIFGCAVPTAAPTSNPEVARIQASCDNKDETQTIINGHTYFCVDYATFERQMEIIQHQLQSRGI